MTFAFVPRLALIWTVIFAMLLTNVSVATPSRTENDRHNREERGGRTGLAILVGLGVNVLGRWLTPLDEWHAEIQKLTEDELFVERWMLLNDDPASIEKGKRAIANIQKQQETIEKKRKRFLWWYYPTVTVIGAGAMMLTFWIRKH